MEKFTRVKKHIPELTNDTALELCHQNVSHSGVNKGDIAELSFHAFITRKEPTKDLKHDTTSHTTDSDLYYWGKNYQCKSGKSSFPLPQTLWNKVANKTKMVDYPYEYATAIADCALCDYYIFMLKSNEEDSFYNAYYLTKQQTADMIYALGTIQCNSQQNNAPLKCRVDKRPHIIERWLLTK